MAFIKLIFFALLALTSCQQYGARAPGYPVTVDRAEQATFFVMKYSLTGTPINSGTAWIAHTDEKNSYLITAGHVCTFGNQPPYMFKLSDRHNKETWATLHATLDKDRGEPDLCLLKTLKPLPGQPLLIADKLPPYGSPAGYVGAPDSNWGDEMAPYLTGYYSGGRLITVPTYPGASGSAVWTSEGVFGIVIKVDMNFHHLAAIVTQSEINAFLTKILGETVWRKTATGD